MRQVAFLRAINIGGRRVRMDRLREILSAMGLAAVETFIASGHVVFDGARDPAMVERDIESELKRRPGFAVETFVRTDAELRRIATLEPFPGQ